MIRLGYLDENKGNRNTFYRVFKKDFDVVMLDDFAKVFTLDLLLEEIDKQEIQVLAVDYKLADSGMVQYDGDQVLAYMRRDLLFIIRYWMLLMSANAISPFL